MRFFIVTILVIVQTSLCAVIAPPSVWPPVWASDTNGSAEGVGNDDHTGFDYGSDQWGYWANLDIEDAAGAPLATIEMRYIEPESFTMGAYPGEEGARIYEFPRHLVPSTDINGGQPFWVSSLECTQQIWEEVKKINGGNKLKLARLGNADINDVDTISFPLDTTAFEAADPVNNVVDPSGRPIDIDTTNAWQVAVDAAFDTAFNLYKAYRAIESQTFQECKDFCELELEKQIQSQTGVGSINIRLPTEKEWEFLCRAGTESAFWSGPILSGIKFKMENQTVNKTDFLFPFDSGIIDADIADALGGDGNLHREWFSEGDTYMHIESMKLDGFATVTMDVRRDLAGTVNISGDLTAVPVIANFDERYQYHYVASVYGSHTPVLMTYVYDGSIYHPRPYEPVAANVYYRYMGTNVYVQAKSITAANTMVNKTWGTQPDSFEPADTVPGDYTALGRLEYCEMVQVNVRCDSFGNENSDGKYTFDSLGNIVPIRTLYTPAAVRKGAIFIGSTLPDMDRGNQSNEDFARQSDLSDNSGEVMTIDDYIRTVKKAAEDHLYDFIDPDPWYSGPRDYNVSYTETEFDVNGNPVEVKKTKTVTMVKIKPNNHHCKWVENITINSSLNSAITAILPKNQMRNPFGLYNTHGNVAEWVDTAWDGLSDHSNHVNGSLQLTRGGSWRTGAQHCRSAARSGRDPSQAYDDVGFRFILTD